MGVSSGDLAPGLMPPTNSLVIELFPVFQPTRLEEDCVL